MIPADRGYFPAMLRRLPLAACLSVLAAPRSVGQLPLITVPRGALRIDLSGALYPNDRIWDGGSTRPLGSTLDGAANPLVASLQANLGQLLGQPVSGLSLGTVTAVAAREHGVGNIGLAYGLTRRITLFTTVPLVFARSRVSITSDGSTSRVGLNPAHPTFGTAGTDAGFFSQFDQALDSLSARVQRGDFTGDPSTLALAQQTLASATAMRAGLFTLLADPARASPVLPTASDAYGVQLLAQISGLQSTLSGRLGVGGFTAAPALPDTPLTLAQFASLVNSPAGFGLTTSNSLPQLMLGDVEAGLAVALVTSGEPGRGSWSGAWLRATARFPTGSAANPSILLDQGTGDKHPALELDGIFEIGRRRLGVRTELSFQHQLARSILQRIGPPDQVLVPASFLAAVTSQPGDSFSIAARPFIAFAPHLALTALAQYWSRGSSRTSYLAGQPPIPGVDPTLLDTGSSGSAIVAGLGLSYSYTGAGRDGRTGLPIEAGWSIERTISSGRGIFPDPLTSRMSLRIYRPLIKH